MQIDISFVKLSSASFARLQSGDAVEGLKDLTLYVKDDSPEWIDAISKLQQFEASVLYDNVALGLELIGIMKETDNLLIPIKDINGQKKLYIVGSVEQPSMLASAVRLMADDVTTVVGMQSLRDYKLNSVSFRGQRTPTGMLQLSKDAEQAYHDMKKNPDYKQMQELKLSLVSIAKEMRSKVDKTRENAKVNFAKAMAVLNEKEKSQVINVLLNTWSSQKELDMELKRVLDRDEMGKNTKCRVLVEQLSRTESKISIISPDGKKYDTNFSDIAKTIYALNLRQRKNKIDVLEPYNLYGNEEQFKKTYRQLVGFDYAGKYVESILSRVREYYNEIENKLAPVFNEIGENYSPFIVNSYMPIVINKDVIKLPEALNE